MLSIIGTQSVGSNTLIHRNTNLTSCVIILLGVNLNFREALIPKTYYLMTRIVSYISIVFLLANTMFNAGLFSASMSTYIVTNFMSIIRVFTLKAHL